jgi:hypothetical protein
VVKYDHVLFKTWSRANKAQLSINQISLLVGTILERDEMKKNSSSFMLAFIDFL